MMLVANLGLSQTRGTTGLTWRQLNSHHASRSMAQRDRQQGKAMFLPAEKCPTDCVPLCSVLQIWTAEVMAIAGNSVS